MASRTAPRRDEPDLLLNVEKPAAGGRMLARHDGQVVLVWGAIPGERVRARVERRGKGLIFATVTEVLEPSPDRRSSHDWRCGGNVLAHVAYARQLCLKGEIVADALTRIGRHPIAPPDVVPSPEQGYRMRARLHVQGSRIGFFREGSHDLCDPAVSGQLLPQTIDWLRGAEDLLRRDEWEGVEAIELSENVAGSERACHLEFAPGHRHSPAASLEAFGAATVSDVIHVRDGDATTALRLHRHARAFFQGNRFVVEPLVRHVTALAMDGPVVDLYAGVGLFGLSLATLGAKPVTLVEGDPVSGADLDANAEPFSTVTVERRSVEAYVKSADAALAGATVIVDPPRTGMSRDALAGVVQQAPRRVIYVSCDVATFARDARTLLDAGYAAGGLLAFDLFPNTAHVEVVARFERA